MIIEEQPEVYQQMLSGVDVGFQALIRKYNKTIDQKE